MKKIDKQIVIYQAKNGAIELKGDFKRETIWATQAQIAEVFGIERSVTTKHIRNILQDKELDENSVCAKFAHTANDGKVYQTQYYNLDVILSVGYRTNSKRAIVFRQWATKTLREHITKGYTINPKIIKKNYAQFQKAVESVKHLLPAEMKTDTGSILELIKTFANTWFLLNAYDKGDFISGKITKKKVVIVASDIVGGVEKLKEELAGKNEASDLFAVEKSAGALEGIVGNVMQSFGGKDIYPGVEEKAAHLLYFIVKNHPFIDGNKRSGAFVFVWFLKRAGMLDPTRITPEALTALTLLIAESNPKDKDKMIGLVAMLVKK